ncbi:MAG: type II toxin-antitoxin system VapC family toxin [Pyrinomonadaceae bacterium]
MTLLQVLIDTDVLSLLMRKNLTVVANARLYLAEHHRFSISVITRYEILRGLKVKGASKQATVFEDFCVRTEVVPISDDVVLRAADIYADLYKRGELIGDADILIAASAMVRECGLATNNEGHFRRIAGLQITNWSK